MCDTICNHVSGIRSLKFQLAKSESRVATLQSNEIAMVEDHHQQMADMKECLAKTAAAGVGLVVSLGLEMGANKMKLRETHAAEKRQNSDAAESNMKQKDAGHTEEISSLMHEMKVCTCLFFIMQSYPHTNVLLCCSF